MKQTKNILFTALVIFLAFSATLYTSCTKDPCSGVQCLNGGVCSGGSCSCPSGYTGSNCQTLITSTLYYDNNTYTPIDITINGSTVTIPVGGSVYFDGVPGDYASGVATTSGVTTSGDQVGLELSWNINDVFPSAGTSATDPLNVSSDYFFLKIINNSAYDINGIYVNYNLTSQTYDDVIVYYGTGLTYNIGYYDAWTNSNLYLTSPSSVVWSYNIGLSFTQNQSYTFTAL